MKGLLQSMYGHVLCSHALDTPPGISPITQINLSQIQCHRQPANNPFSCLQSFKTYVLLLSYLSMVSFSHKPVADVRVPQPGHLAFIHHSDDAGQHRVRGELGEPLHGGHPLLRHPQLHHARHLHPPHAHPPHQPPGQCSIGLMPSPFSAIK